MVGSLLLKRIICGVLKRLKSQGITSNYVFEYIVNVKNWIMFIQNLKQFNSSLDHFFLTDGTLLKTLGGFHPRKVAIAN